MTAYAKELCDLGWCFKNAVGQALPATFSSYPNDTAIPPTQGPSPNSPVLPLALQNAISQLTPPSVNTVESLNSSLPSSTLSSAPSVSSSLSSILPTSTPALAKRHRAFHHRPSNRRQRTRKHPRDFDYTERDLSPSQNAISQGYDDGFTGKFYP